MSARYASYAVSLTLTLACSASKGPNAAPNATSSGAIGSSPPPSAASTEPGTDGELSREATLDDATNCTSCSTDVTAAQSSVPPTEPNVPSTTAATTSNAVSSDVSPSTHVVNTELPGDPSAELYAPERLPEFRIELSEAALETLSLVSDSEDPRQDTYVKATLRYGDEVVEDNNSTPNPRGS